MTTMQAALSTIRKVGSSSSTAKAAARTGDGSRRLLRTATSTATPASTASTAARSFSSPSTVPPSPSRPPQPPNPLHDVRIVEVGPRDGLQNEPLPISVDDKLELIRRLELAGRFSSIEVGACVSPRWVPQMADSDRVLAGLRARREGDAAASADVPTRYSVLVPNLRGLEMAIAANAIDGNHSGDGNVRCGNGVVDEVAIFGAASEAFSQRNINATIDESMERFRAVVERAHQESLPVRGYVSTVIACPYQGRIAPAQVAKVVEKMLDLGCYEVSLGDTIGVGTPGTTSALLKEVLTVAKPSHLAMHCHDTYGQALANILVGLQNEIFTVDASVAGLGGCPYAKGASGNVATEDVVYMLHGMGLSTGVDLDRLVDAGEFICGVLNRRTESKVARAIMAKRESS